MYTYVLIVVLLHCLELNKLFVLENKSCELAGRFTLDDSVAKKFPLHSLCLYLLMKLFKINMQLYLIKVKFFNTSVLIST